MSGALLEPTPPPCKPEKPEFRGNRGFSRNFLGQSRSPATPQCPRACIGGPKSCVNADAEEAEENRSPALLHCPRSTTCPSQMLVHADAKDDRALATPMPGAAILEAKLGVATDAEEDRSLAHLRCPRAGDPTYVVEDRHPAQPRFGFSQRGRVDDIRRMIVKSRCIEASDNTRTIEMTEITLSSSQFLQSFHSEGFVEMDSDSDSSSDCSSASD